MAMGVSKDEVMHSTLISIRIYDKAYKIRRKMIDEQQYFQAIYIYEALNTVLGNVLRKKGSKPKSYRSMTLFEEMEKNEHEKHLSEEEKAERIDALFSMLGGMQERFEKSGGT